MKSGVRMYLTPRKIHSKRIFAVNLCSVTSIHYLIGVGLSAIVAPSRHGASVYSIFIHGLETELTSLHFTVDHTDL